MIVFNSFPRSGNVFMSTLGNFFNLDTSTDHNPKLYYNSSINQCAYFREPKECTASWVYRNMNISESQGKYVKWEDYSSIDELIIRNLNDYKIYIKSAIENKNTLYIGNFLNIKEDPYNEIKKITKYFNIKIDSKWIYNLDEIKNKLYSENLMTSPDGHMPRPKAENRLNIETYIQQSNLFEEAALMYESLIYN